MLSPDPYGFGFVINSSVIPHHVYGIYDSPALSRINSEVWYGTRTGLWARSDEKGCSRTARDGWRCGQRIVLRPRRRRQARWTNGQGAVTQFQVDEPPPFQP